MTGVAATANEGELAISWGAVGDWLDYAGFKIYSVDGSNNITEISNCQCTGLDCKALADAASPYLGCTVSGLDANRSYTIHVRPYDKYFNEAQPDVATFKSAPTKTLDLTAPSVAASIIPTLNQSDMDLSFTKSTDNQYETETNAKMTYYIYRKDTNDHGGSPNDFTFPIADVNNPGGAVLDAGSGYTLQVAANDATSPLTFKDTTISDGKTYYYLVCTEDDSGNRACDSSSNYLSISDITKPTIDSVTLSNWTMETFDLSWVNNDNITPQASLNVQIRQKFSNDPNDFPSLSDTIVTSGANITSLTAQVDDDGTSLCSNYLITAADAAGNQSVNGEVSVAIGVTLGEMTDKLFSTGTHLLAGDSATVDYVNSANSLDDYVTYDCVYDKVVDDAVAGSDSCNLISGVSYAADTGLVSFDPTYKSAGTYELKMTATGPNGSTDTDVFTVQIGENVTTTNLLTRYDAAFSNVATSSVYSSASSFTDLSLNSNATLSGGTGWTGAGTQPSPYALTLDGTDAKLDSGVSLGSNSVMFSTWIKPGASSQADKYIATNTDSTDGFYLKQSGDKVVFGVEGITEYHEAVLADSPTGYWRFDEASGTTVVDETGNGHDLTMTYGSPTYSEPGVLYGDPESYSRTGAGPNHTYRITNDTTLSFGSDDFAIEVWAKTNIPTQGQIFYGSSNYAHQLYMLNSGQIRWYTHSNVRLTSTTTIHDGQWYHIVFKKDSGVYKLFIDGSLESSVATGDTFTTFTSANFFGAASGSSPFLGSYDEAALYMGANTLTDAEILEHYELGRVKHKCVSSTSLDSSKWSHIAGSYDGTNLELLVNGSSECESAVGSYTANSANNVVVGSTPADSDHWSGSVASFELYSSGTDAEAISNFMNSANKFRETPIEGIVTADLFAAFDPANANGGIDAYPDQSCDLTLLCCSGVWRRKGHTRRLFRL